MHDLEYFPTLVMKNETLLMTVIVTSSSWPSQQATERESVALIYLQDQFHIRLSAINAVRVHFFLPPLG